ncbi:oxidoreductase [Leptolyngbya sp. BL0902]|uniref:iron-containing alcohol dehydrogenase family protein n=1 Tax=Leptolyngbya sp. BL0902 TaxID=1115757 RepID=UPI0018E909DD|nr:iron-containing alcohol dehydrogenase family protein [Leptolyngbya sp. BL0902]QQE65527.1 oxidoreductase [Leptolyngbya sp. BL0902]
MTTSLSVTSTLAIAPAQVVRGEGILSTQGEAIAALGQHPLVVGGQHSLPRMQPLIESLTQAGLTPHTADYGRDCSEATLERLRGIAQDHQTDVVIGVGGGKALDTAKLLAHQRRCPVVTVPTSGATCAAWTALSNVYSEAGAFRYDVALDRCPDRLILDYALIRTSPPRTLVAGIGDGLAKWYEASVSSGSSDQTLIISAVQQGRVLRDILFQKTPAALRQWGGPEWREVVDATVLLAGVIGGVGGAQCRTVAAHAVHNGLTQLPACHDALHGEKVAYGILVQLRLEEMGGKSSLATAARQQLIQFYRATGLPQTLADLGLGNATLADLQQAADFACREGSDIHHLPFTVSPDALLAAMVSPLCPELRERPRPSSSPSTAPSEV